MNKSKKAIRWNYLYTFLLGITALGCASLVSAQDSSAVGVPSNGLMMLKTLVGLMVVVVAIYALAWLSKRFSLGGVGRNNPMSVVAVLPLGTKEKAILVDVAGQQMLLGVAQGNISILRVFEEPVIERERDRQEKPLPASSLAANTASEFSKKLNHFLSQGNKS